MKIYIAHSKKMNYEEELYKPLRQEESLKKHKLILPHEKSETSSNDREFYKKIDLFIADCSEKGTGLGIELGWAYDDGKKIYCIYQEEKNIGQSISKITSNIYSYKDTSEMVELIKNIITKETN